MLNRKVVEKISHRGRLPVLTDADRIIRLLTAKLSTDNRRRRGYLVIKVGSDPLWDRRVEALGFSADYGD